MIITEYEISQLQKRIIHEGGPVLPFWRVHGRRYGGLHGLVRGRRQVPRHAGRRVGQVAGRGSVRDEEIVLLLLVLCPHGALLEDLRNTVAVGQGGLHRLQGLDDQGLRRRRVLHIHQGRVKEGEQVSQKPAVQSLGKFKDLQSEK